MKERLVLPLDSSMQCLSDAWRGQECVWYCADVTDMTDSVRASCARVVDAASHVTIDAERLESFAQSLVCGGRGTGAVEIPHDCAALHLLPQDVNLPLLTWDAMGWHYTADAKTGGPLTAQVGHRRGVYRAFVV